MPQRWETAFEEAAIGMALVALDGTWIEVNHAVCELMGYTAPELRRMTFQDITFPEDLDADLANVQALLDDRIGSYQMEKRYLRKDGRTVWCLLTVTLVRDRRGKPRHFIAQIQDVDDRKRAEFALAESESRYRSLFEEAADGILLTDQAGRIFDCNPALEGMLDQDRRELEGGLVWDFVVGSQARSRLKKAFADGSALRDLETSVRSGSGDPVPVDITVLPQLSSANEVRGFQVRVHDLTAHTAAVRNERRVKAIVDSSADAIMAGDLEGRIIAWNQGATRIFGYTAEEAIGQHASLIAPPEFTEEPRELIRRVTAGEAVVGHETVRVAKDGERIAVAMTMSRIQDDEGNLAGFSVISRDIRESKASEEAIRRAAANLRTIVRVQEEVANAGLNRREVARLIALRAQELTEADGAAIAEMTDEATMRLVAGTGMLDGSEGHEVPADASIAGECVRQNLTIYSPDTQNDARAHQPTIEKSGIGSMALVPLVDRGGTTTVLEVVSRERDAFGEDELQLIEVMAGFMAGAIRDASAYERQQQLLEEREAYATELERSNIALHEFASIASHDLQEPLRKVRAFGDRLKSSYADALDERGADYIDRMRGAATRMQSLIEDLLNYSRITTTARPFERICLNDVLEEVVQDLSLRIEQTGATIHWKDLPAVEADAMQMRQLFQNMLANSMKFAREGVPPVIDLAAAPIDEAWEIRLRDNGIGFEQGYAQQIFRPFERLHGRAEYEGTGMGLAICRKIVERHGGYIKAESAPEQGATFVIRIPEEQWRRGKVS